MEINGNYKGSFAMKRQGTGASLDIGWEACYNTVI
jgi:hypothetical protein